MFRNVLITFGLIVLTWAVFGQTRNFVFINYDDPGHVTARPELRDGMSISGIRWVFTTTFVGNYIPVTGLTLLADYSLHGLDAGGYHLTNVLLHTLNGLLLFLFLLRTTGAAWPSAIVAALFLLHPLRAGSVAWISSRKDLTCGIFWMLTLHAYASYATKPHVARYALVLFTICLALLSKPMAVTLPCVLLLIDAWPLGRLSRMTEQGGSFARALGRLALEKIPFFVPVIAASTATLIIQNRSGAVSSVEQFPLTDRVANAASSYFLYIAKTVAPLDLIPIYPYDAADSWSLFAGAAALLGVAVTVLALFAVRRAPWLTSGWLWYVGTLVPVIGLIQVGAQSMADRYTYLPQIGLWIVLVWGLRTVSRENRFLQATLISAALVAIGASAAVAHAQTSRWRDSVSLWSYTVDVDPDNAIAQSLLGEAHLALNHSEEARTHLSAAIELQPDHRPALLNLAKLDVQQGNLSDALAHCRYLVELRPDDPDAHTTWASVLIRRDEPLDALRHIEVALGADPDHADALINQGAALLMLDRAQAAIAPLERAVALAPDDPAALTNLATANYVLGNLDRSLALCTRALQLDPNYEPALTLRGDLDAHPAR